MPSCNPLRAILLATLAATLAPAQTWTTLPNSPPADVSLCLLLTDGGVMCQSGSIWYKLTPDLSGSYLKGTWSSLASLPSGYEPDDYASAVLADGRLVMIGGEYNNGLFALTKLGAIYDPVTNIWTPLSPPPSTGSPNHFQCIGDAPATVLADGRFLIGSKLYQDVAVLDPASLTWSLVSISGKIDGFNSEEGWMLLPDGSVFTLDIKNAPATERFLIAPGATTGVWVSSGNTPQDLHTPGTGASIMAPGCPLYNPPGEMGPTLLLPNGTVFAVGADGLTGIYTPPPSGTGAGSWAQGPAMPAGLNVEDGPGAVLPNGHVLFGGSPGSDGNGLQYFEFDGVNLNSIPAPAGALYDASNETSLLVLPTGQVLFIDGTSTVQLYNPASSPAYNPAWAPAITNVPTSLTAGNTYEISGTQFNGLNQGSAYGDEMQNATNYPLVRITNNATGDVFYARTHDHSSMGVATGSTLVYTNFDVPANIDAGESTIQVVANGIPSAPVAVTVTSSTYGTITTVGSSANPSVSGQPVTFTATASSGGGTPTGTVTFYNGATTLGAVTLNASGQASLTTSSLTVGAHSITAVYSGMPGFNTSTSSVLTQVVGFSPVYGTVTTLGSSANPSVLGQPVTFTATTSSSGGTPTGTVTFYNGAAVLGAATLNASGQASLTTFSLTVGMHSIAAVYGGAASFTSTFATLTETVNQGGATIVPGVANYDSSLMAPACHTVGASCDSSALLNGRFNLNGGSEPNSSNTLFNSCPDGSSGAYHMDESNDRLQISSLDGQPFAAGKVVRITATVWAYSNFNVDFLDLYSAPNANSPVWTLIGTVQPTAMGAQVLSLTYTLPNGSLQAIRANFRFSGRASACTVGGYNDHDDLVFAVGSTSATPPPAPVITSATNASGNVGSNFSYSITATNSPASFNATGLPTGLSVNMTTGLISGMPGVTGTFPVNLSATNSGGTGTAVLTLTINPALPSAPVITSPSTALGSVGAGFSYSITATNSPTSYSAGGLPSWLSINPTTGLISGVPLSAGTFTLTLTATNGAGSGPGNLTLTISPPVPPQAPVALMTVTPQSGAAPLTVTCDASASTGGNLTYAWNFGDHSIAFGRVVTHTYSTPGLYGITVTISNSLGTANARTTISVSGLSGSISTDGAP